MNFNIQNMSIIQYVNYLYVITIILKHTLTCCIIDTLLIVVEVLNSTWKWGNDFISGSDSVSRDQLNNTVIVTMS